MKKIIILIFFISNNIVAQDNLVPNPGFEETGVDKDNNPTGHGSPQCNDHYSGKPSSNAKDFESDIQNWKLIKPYTIWNHHSSDLEGPECSTEEKKDCDGNFTGNRFMAIGGGGGGDDMEGVRVILLEELKAGHKYVFRCWSRFPVNGNDKFQDITFSNGPSWWNNSGNDLFTNAVEITANPRGEAACMWFITQKTFEVPGKFGDNLETMVINPSRCNGFFFIDNVELFKFCPDTMRIINKDYKVSELLNEAKFIRAGLIHGIQAPNKYNVIVFPDVKVTYKAEKQIKLQRGFIAKGGSQFHAYIAPCGKMCDPSVEDYMHLTKLSYTLCKDIKFGIGIQIGGAAKAGLQYNWTSTNPDHLKYLDKTNISNPTFKIPSWDKIPTRMTYLITVKDKCGNVATDEVTINLSDNISDEGNFYVAGYLPLTPPHLTGYLDIWLSLSIRIVKITIDIVDPVTGIIVATKTFILPGFGTFPSNYGLYTLTGLSGLTVDKIYNINLTLEDICGLKRTIKPWAAFSY